MPHENIILALLWVPFLLRSCKSLFRPCAIVPIFRSSCRRFRSWERNPNSPLTTSRNLLPLSQAPLSPFRLLPRCTSSKWNLTDFVLFRFFLSWSPAALSTFASIHSLGAAWLVVLLYEICRTPPPPKQTVLSPPFKLWTPSCRDQTEDISLTSTSARVSVVFMWSCFDPPPPSPPCFTLCVYELPLSSLFSFACCLRVVVWFSPGQQKVSACWVFPFATFVTERVSFNIRLVC